MHIPAFKTPERIQRFLNEECIYNKEPDGPSCRGPLWVMRERRAHCVEGSVFAAAALRQAGYPPLLWDLESVRDDDHVLAIFRKRGHWGAIGKSNYAGLGYREPVYRTLRELAMSYFDPTTTCAAKRRCERSRGPWTSGVSITSIG